ncbi:hypothetical protein CRM73_00150 [Kocuria sp. CCUG 69068]|nr:hypothetical protein [Kocuria sp. CCUG 69068]
MEVYAIYPTGSTEPDEQGRRPVVTGQTVLAPISAKGKIGAHDLVQLPDGLTYEVVGRPRVWENNPHAHTRRNEGVQIEIELSEG